ncbi:unnamed protein product [Rhizoctonia solani]|uniref:Lysine-specific metallo-endopeptidase domain-containing protein n=1 Tax=Rhizoctonia solani TaxID=456999 RepID=A0A8H2WKY5_9AGAM|nr:unnamed protein product [Rhizoctonia solani]
MDHSSRLHKSAPTDTFSITCDSSTQVPRSTGIKLKYVPGAAVAVVQDANFIVLIPGQSIEVDHTLGGVLYLLWARFLQGLFKLARKLATPSSQSLSRNAQAAGVMSKLAVRYIGCIPFEHTLVSAAATASNTLVADANSYLGTLLSGTTHYATWFVTYSASTVSTVGSYFSLRDTDATSTNYNCSTCWDNPTLGITYSTTYAYVYPGALGKVSPYHAKSNLQTKPKSPRIDLSLWCFLEGPSGTDDITYVYDQTNAKSLVGSNPAQAINGADNHEYMWVNTLNK